MLTSMPLDRVMSQSSLLRADELINSRRTSDQLRIGSNRVLANGFVFALADKVRFMADAAFISLNSKLDAFNLQFG